VDSTGEVAIRDRDGSLISRLAGWIAREVEEYDSRGSVVLVYCIRRMEVGMSVALNVEICDPGLIGLPKDFGDDKGRIVDRSCGPLVYIGKIAWRGREGLESKPQSACYLHYSKHSDRRRA
jgi:hypothetical protein